MNSLHLYFPEMTGCSDGGCIFVKNTGMITNGGCSCERELQRTPEGFKAARTIRWLRDRLKAESECSYSDFEPMGK